jgi:formylmethanofuran dehydrogenase subunit B
MINELLKNQLITKNHLEEMSFSIEDIEGTAEPDPTIRSQLNDLINQLKYTEYITIFLGTAILNKQFLNENKDYLDKFFSLINALNEKMRVALITLKYSYNSTGFFQEYEMSDKSVQIRHLHNAFTTNSDYDVILSIGSDIISKLSIDNLKNLQGTSIITLDYKHTPTTDLSQVVIPVAITGLESEGLVTRMDNIVLKLTAPLKNNLLDDEEVLNRFLELI